MQAVGGSDIELIITLALIAVWAVAFGTLCGRLASQRDRPTGRWFLLGAIFGPAAMIVLHEGPPGHCASCRAPVTGLGRVCQWCGNDVTTGAPGDRATSVPTRPAVKAAVPTTAPPVSAPPEPVPAAPDKPRPGPGAEDWDPADASSVAVVPPPKPAQAPGAAGGTPQERLNVSGVFVTGSVGLSVGSRYTVQIVGPRLRVLGPHDRDPAIIALDRDLIGMDATGHDGRLIINQVHRGRADLVLVFMSLTGRTTDSAATEIVQAVRAVEASKA